MQFSADDFAEVLISPDVEDEFSNQEIQSRLQRSSHLCHDIADNYMQVADISNAESANGTDAFETSSQAFGSFENKPDQLPTLSSTPVQLSTSEELTGLQSNSSPLSAHHNSLEFNEPILSKHVLPSSSASALEVVHSSSIPPPPPLPPPVKTYVPLLPAPMLLP